MPTNYAEQVGKRFDHLTVIDYIPCVGKVKAKFKCRCDCGREKTMRATVVMGGATSCGCLAAINSSIANRTHGQTKSPTWMSWQSMKSRCFNRNDISFERYGGRGINVCERWLVFENFIADMGVRPGLEYSIDRFPDKNGNYSPENCRWATDAEQANNTRSNVVVTWNGKSQTVSQWSRELGINVTTLCYRLKQNKPLAEVFA